MNMVTILMMSAKFATLALLKITVFSMKGVDVDMWPKFGNSSYSIRKVKET